MIILPAQLDGLRTLAETWKDITTWEGIYLMSDMGRIKSAAKDIEYADGRAYSYTEKIRKLTLRPDGYLCISASEKDMSEIILVHRAVGLAFIPNPENKKFINHKNGVKIDNRAVNLEWSTAKENVNHAFNAGLMNPTKGSSNHFAKLTEAEVLAVRKLFKDGVSPKEISVALNIGYRNVYHICSGQTWRHLI